MKAPEISKDDPIILGGFGEKKSNGGTQWFTQNRVYNSNTISTAITTCCLPWYLVIVDGDEN